MKKVTTAKALCLYVFLGTLIGDIIILLATLPIGFNTRNVTDLDSYKFILLFALISYPFALIIGGIPALISGVLINAVDNQRTKYLRAGLIGFVVSILFYSVAFKGLDHEATTLALVGAVAAVGTRFRINQIENKG